MGMYKFRTEVTGPNGSATPREFEKADMAVFSLGMAVAMMGADKVIRAEVLRIDGDRVHSVYRRFL